ncbi:MAG TPA: fatty acid CoA ligase family protein [Lacunisphaera sp.]|nr:fatty acid CoA ligase family protein [Lacunisphaera sp.]
MSDSANIARHLPLMAERQPETPAIKVPRGRTSDDRIDYLTLTFRELDAEVDTWCAHLTGKGVRQGDRVLVMVRQGLPLIAAAFALFKLGAVPVIIDPGMGRKNFLACVARSKPRVLLGIPLAQVMSHLFRSAFANVEVRVWASSSATARLDQSKIGNQESKMVSSTAADLAAVLFTSGSTGAPKGVCYEHGMFDAQVRLVRDTYRIKPGEVDMPMLPIFALFNPALGMTTIVPEIDPSRPADADPAKIVQAIQQENVTNSFGSPTLWRKIFDHCLENHLTLPSLRRVLCAGAAVPASVWSDSERLLPNGFLHSPYGATEALPISSVSSHEIFERKGSRAPGTKSQFEIPTIALGALVGRPLPANQVKIIALHDGPLASLADARELPPGEIGEIIVTGPTVTREYDQLPEATAQAKIRTLPLNVRTKGELTVGADSVGNWRLTAGVAVPDDAVWHRMGDAGYLDTTGRLWFCGRIAERVVTRTSVMHTEPCERVFRGYPGVARCALIGLGERGRQEPALVVQPLKPLTAAEQTKLAEELRAVALQQPHTVAIARFFFHPSLPVDVRHNAKIHRLTLARWATEQKGQ